MLLTSIQDRCANLKGDFGVCYINLKTGSRLFCGNCHVFPASGTVKLMALVECFKAIEEHRIDPDATYVLDKKRLPVIDAPTYGALHSLHDGIELTVMDLCLLMTTVSDNQAFNALVDLLGMEQINQTFRSLGYPNMRINRQLFDLKKIRQGVDNTTSIKEMATLFERMYKGQIITPEASAQMLKLMELHQRTSVLPYHFGETARISHQTGFDENIIIDGGILYFDTPFLLTMAASNMDIRKAETILRDITLICYEETLFPSSF